MLDSNQIKERIVSAEKAASFAEDSHGWDSLELSGELLNDVENIADGTMSPLEGFMTRNELSSVLDNMRLEDGSPWTIPILLPVSPDFQAKDGESIVLSREGAPKAIMEIEEKYSFPKEEIASKTFGTTDPNHPGVGQVLEAEGTFIGGKITLISKTRSEFEQYAFSPRRSRELFKEKGWKKIVGFQTRNVPHLGHEYVQKAALTFVDGLFINPVIGKKKVGDFKDNVI